MEKLSIEEIKNRVDMVDFLASRGYEVKRVGTSWFANIRGEKTASLKLERVGNRYLFIDFGNPNLKGSIIDLVQYLDRINFVEAVNTLRNHLGDYSYIKQKGKKHATTIPAPKTINKPVSTKQPTAPKMEVQNLKDLKRDTNINNRNKIVGLEKQAYLRGISKNTLQNSKVSFMAYDKYYYLGLPNDKGGYSLRNSMAKFNIGNTAILSEIIDKNKPTIVVEGLFDYLSAKEVSKNEPFNYIVLNSTTKTKEATDFIINNDLKKVALLLDNDKSGLEAADYMRNELDKANIDHIDFSIRVLGNKHKDLNEFLMDNNKLNNNLNDRLLSKLKNYDKLTLNKIQILQVPKNIVNNVLLFDNKSNFEAFYKTYGSSLHNSLVLYVDKNSSPTEIKNKLTELYIKKVFDNTTKLYGCTTDVKNDTLSSLLKEAGIRKYEFIQGVKSANFIVENKSNLYKKTLHEALLNNTSFLKF